MATGEDTSRAAVAAAVERALGPAAGVTRAQMLSGGAMHEWWSADVAGASPSSLVVRLSPAARDDAAKAQAEYAVLAAVRERGVRAPAPLFAGEDAAGRTAMVLERMPGDSNPRPLLTAPEFGDARAAIIPQLAEDLARIHTVPGDAVPLPKPSPEPGGDPILFAIDQQEADYGLYRLNPHPLLEWAFRWLRRQAAALPRFERPLHLVHGDFRIGNLLYTRDGLSALLDWEGSHAGEAEEDLAWFCTRVWRFNRRDLEAGGITDRETWVRAYEVASGRAVDRERFALWEVLQNVRWAVICMRQADQHLSGIMDSHEHAAIGRRAADTELEVLRLVGAA